MADLSDINSAQSVKIIGANSSGVETTPVNATSLGESYTRVSPAPLQDVIYKVVNLTNPVGGAKTINVNGSVTPVTFSFVPAVGETWYLDGLHLSIGDSNAPDFNVFGSLGVALTNGLVLEVISKGVTYEITNLIDNTDIVNSFVSTYAPASSGGWMNDADVFNGALKFEHPIILQNSTGDLIRFRVRDNLININWLQARIKVWRMP